MTLVAVIATVSDAFNCVITLSSVYPVILSRMAVATPFENVYPFRIYDRIMHSAAPELFVILPDKLLFTSERGGGSVMEVMDKN